MVKKTDTETKSISHYRGSDPERFLETLIWVGERLLGQLYLARSMDFPVDGHRDRAMEVLRDLKDRITDTTL